LIEKKRVKFKFLRMKGSKKGLPKDASFSGQRNINNLSPLLFRKVLSYLPLVDYHLLNAVCKKWQNFVETQNDVFLEIDLSIYPKKLPLSVIIKTANLCPNLKRLVIAELYRDTEYSR
jgi:F-box domain